MYRWLNEGDSQVKEMFLESHWHYIFGENLVYKPKLKIAEKKLL